MFSIITEIKNLKRPNFFLVPYQKYIYDTFQLCSQQTNGTANRAQKQPESGKNPVNRVIYGKRMSVADNMYQFSANLRSGQRSFHCGLIISHRIKAVLCNTADPV